MGRQFILGYFRLKQLKVTRPERNAKLAASSTSSRRWRRGPWTENPWKMVNHRFCDAKRNWKRNDNDRCCKTARSNFIYKSSAIFLSDEVSLHILCNSAQFFLQIFPSSNKLNQIFFGALIQLFKVAFQFWQYRKNKLHESIINSFLHDDNNMMSFQFKERFNERQMCLTSAFVHPINTS